MSNISSIGINSGVLTSDLIDKLISAEREPTELRLDRKQSETEEQLSAFGQLKNALSDLRLESRVLSTPSSFNLLKATSGFSGISATASNNAALGSYSLEVTQLAQSHSLASGDFAAVSDEVGQGTLDISVGNNSVQLTIDGTNSSLEGIAAEINAQQDLGVTASIVYTGSVYRLVLSSEDTGLDNKISISVSGDSVGTDTDTSGLSQLVFNDTTQNLNETVEALDAEFEVNGIPITRSSNTVNDVISGVTFDFTAENTGSPATVKIANDIDTMADNVQDFVDAYNAFRTLYNEYTAFNPDTLEGGVLLGDNTLKSIFGQVNSDTLQVVAGLEGETLNSLYDVGVSISSETGVLNFDRNKFAAAVKSSSEDVTALFANQGRTTDAQVEFVASTNKSQRGSYDIEVTALATQGNLTGMALSVPVTIDSDNDNFSIAIDGTTSGTIALTQGSYTTGAELAAEIEAQINADSSLSSAGRKVTVEFTAGMELSITSSSYGSKSTVQILTLDTNTTADLGLSNVAGTTGTDVEGTINGVEASGSGQILTASDDDVSAGIKVRIKGGSTGARGDVVFIRGVGDLMVRSINSFLGVDGLVTNRESGLNLVLDDISDERLKLEDRLDILRQRLANQFTASDILIGQLNKTGDFLTNFFNSLQPKKDN